MPIEGTITCEWLDSKLLAGNPAGVPTKRPLHVYLPKSAKSMKSKDLATIYCLAPWTSAGRTLMHWQPFKEALPYRLERLINEKKIPPCVLVCPDLYTEYGGSQYIDSDFFGPHGTHIIEEIIPYVEQQFPVKPGAAHRAVFGRSSGGYGALRLAMDFGESFGAVACHSGDMGFDLLFQADLIVLSKKLVKYDYDVQAFLQYCRQAEKLASGDVHLLMLLGSCGFYSPSRTHKDGFEMPIDLYNGSKKDDLWQQWLQHDPVQRIDQKIENFKKLSYFYLECGLRDQYNLLYGARQFHEKLKTYGMSHDYYEFKDNHSGTDYRYDTSLPKLLDVIA